MCRIFQEIAVQFCDQLEFQKEKKKNQCAVSPVPDGRVSLCEKRVAGSVFLSVPRVSLFLNTGLICQNLRTENCFEPRTYIFPVEIAPTA